MATADRRRKTPAEVTEWYHGIQWWNELSDLERLSWLNLAGSARPVDAYREYLRREVGRGHQD